MLQIAVFFALLSFVSARDIWWNTLWNYNDSNCTTGKRWDHDFHMAHMFECKVPNDMYGKPHGVSYQFACESGYVVERYYLRHRCWGNPETTFWFTDEEAYTYFMGGCLPRSKFEVNSTEFMAIGEPIPAEWIPECKWRYRYECIGVYTPIILSLLLVHRMYKEKFD
eukprot:gnl/TRDRNA2_/TRDRNA2_44597_c0_seq1.p1 gnl/TRDRNA2_/TRDRNA2_44597_c0~~gnl/TRDRNA2_/TRDRNA2_44597_c0_seq1.p1  ORF type:complete len:167 (-),score=24.68 gnl/TRDRNA2_/TRDRNA2_44597_c0_seq1:178-678(-)